MKCKVDISGIDALFGKRTEARLTEARIQAGRDAIRHARRIGNYQDHTRNLRNANGFCVVTDGRITAIEVDNDGVHKDAAEQTVNLLTYSEKSHDGLYMANGMPYASFVEAKGFEVIRSAGLFAEARLKKLLKSK